MVNILVGAVAGTANGEGIVRNNFLPASPEQRVAQRVEFQINRAITCAPGNPVTTPVVVPIARCEGQAREGNPVPVLQQGFTIVLLGLLGLDRSFFSKPVRATIIHVTLDDFSDDHFRGVTDSDSWRISRSCGPAHFAAVVFLFGQLQVLGQEGPKRPAILAFDEMHRPLEKRPGNTMPVNPVSDPFPDLSFEARFF